MDDRKTNIPMMIAAALCLMAALAGGTLVFTDGGQAIGLGLLGFFGAGAWVLGRKALGHD